MLLLFTLLLFVAIDAYDITALNQFSADVDIYDMGTMGRGKNACSWHRSLAANQEVFYYLAMQPWRHLVWTDCTGTECYKYYINEDASEIPTLNTDNTPKNKLKIEDANDYCRKEYANPLPVFDIDWNQIGERDVLQSIDVNGKTCYRHPAKEPLAYIYLEKQFTRERDVDVMIPCRFDFIGGKSITFRSFNEFSGEFLTDKHPNGYKLNKTRCYIDPTPNNVDTDLAIVLGISDANVVQQVNGALSKLGELKSVKQVKVYYLSGDSLKRETVALDNLASLKLKSISTGPVDALINTAKNELIARVNSKAIYRGTIVVLMDKALTSTFDAQTSFDRNNITVHTVLYNPKGDNQMRIRARALLSVGEQYHEFSTVTGVNNVVNELFIGIRTNLTERCNRTSCNGFCDGRDRCTCPMCCENTCFFTYCNTTTATCTPWPEANPKKKLTCKNDCVGTQDCKDLEGCVYTKYNEGCAPRAKCMKPYCDSNNKCQQKSTCEYDRTPSFENKCWSYKCNEQNGNCERDKSGDPCPKLTDLCHEYSCDANLKCTQTKKTCVKTAPYTEMPCLDAVCNKKTGMCENVMNCKDMVKFTGCGMSADISNCVCNSADGYKCSCTKVKDPNTPPEGYCKEDEICDASDESKKPTCRESNCHQDLYIEGCEIKTCNEETGQIEWKQYDCKKNVTVKAVPNENGEFEQEAKDYCLEKIQIYCDGGDCFADWVDGASPKAGCGECIFSSKDFVEDENKYHKTYTVSYKEDCNYMELTCPGGNVHPNYTNFFKMNLNTYQVITGKCLKRAVDKGNGDMGFEYYCGLAEFNDDYIDASPLTICEACFQHMPCYKAEDYMQITYDKKTGECGFETIKDPAACSICNANNDGYIPTCDNKKVDKIFEETIGGKTVTRQYTIPKNCSWEDQCIVDPTFKCDNTNNPEINAIYELLKGCAAEGSIKAEYHYSLKYSAENYKMELPQSQEFLDEMEEKAYCTWTYELKPCHVCSIENDNLKNTDKCVGVADEYKHLGEDENGNPIATVTCNARTNDCDVSIKEPLCPPNDCWYFYNDKDKQIATGNGCTNSSLGTCKPYWDDEISRLAAFKKVTNEALGDKYPEIECYHEVKCSPDDQITCDLLNNSAPCIEAYNDYIENNKDFGCRIPNVECDHDTLHCTFTEITHPINDTRFFQDRDGVVFGDKCYDYTCQEYVNATTGKIEHHWVLTEKSVIELSKEPETICDTVHCDPETGLSVSERRQCDPISDYGLSERMAQCFQCACSMQTGENVLTMRPNTETETYELDACGNCVVRDRATGNQVNEVVECVLAQPVNLTGAIAGATVAASVVFGLIGSMVVVSIGALQTYQLVSSAMKNVISTTLENPEFVAADNEATNVLNNGD